MLISIFIKLTINLICDIIIIPASVYNCVSSPTVNAQFIELTTNENRLKWINPIEYYFLIHGNGVELHRKYIKLIRILFSEMLKINIKKKKSFQ